MKTRRGPGRRGLTALSLWLAALLLPGVGCDDTEPGPAAGPPYETLSEWGLFEGDLAQQRPAAGVFLIEPAAPLWSDGTVKARWLALPAGTRARLTEREEWELPDGTVVAKTFGFRLDEREADGAVRQLETRLLVRESGEWKPYVYLWNEAQTEALRHVAGAKVVVPRIDAAGAAIEQPYIVPNLAQCSSCHERSDVSRLLGVITPQLNRTVTREGEEVNQLSWLAAQGVLDIDGVALGGLERFVDPYGDGPLEGRARSWLHANCAHCHQTGGDGGSTGLELTAWEPADSHRLGFCKTPVAAGDGAGDLQFDITPGRPDESIMVFRISSTESDVRMPELPNLLPDPRGVELIGAWIAAMEPQACEP